MPNVSSLTLCVYDLKAREVVLVVEEPLIIQFQTLAMPNLSVSQPTHTKHPMRGPRTEPKRTAGLWQTRDRRTVLGRVTQPELWKQTESATETHHPEPPHGILAAPSKWSGSTHPFRVRSASPKKHFNCLPYPASG